MYFIDFGTEMSNSSDTEEEESLLLIAVPLLHSLLTIREPCTDGSLPGAQWVNEILVGNSNRIFNIFRMERHVFINLCNLMISRHWLSHTRYLRVEEQVGIFLYAVGRGSSNRDLQERFQHSGETISRIFKKVLKGMRMLSDEYIKPRPFDVIPDEILTNPKYNPYFKVKNYNVIIL